MGWKVTLLLLAAGITFGFLAHSAGVVLFALALVVGVPWMLVDTVRHVRHRKA